MVRATSKRGYASQRSALVLLLLVACMIGAHAWTPSPTTLAKEPSRKGPWCDAAAPVQWSDLLIAPGKTVLGKLDLYSCSVLSPSELYNTASSSSSSSAITQIALHIAQASSSKAAGATLRQAMLMDCDANLWQLSGIQDSEHACVASTSLLMAACNQWSITVPGRGQSSSQSCTPSHTAYATAGSLQGRVLVLQAHWELPQDSVNDAVTLPDLKVTLGSPAADSTPTAGGAVVGQPELWGAFVGAGMYPPSRMSGSLQAFQLTAAADGDAAATAALTCSKRCTYVPLSKSAQQAVTVVGFSFQTFDRATNVSFHIKRSKWASSEAPVHISTAPGQGVVALQEPLQLHAGDVVSWRCTYDMSGLQPGAALAGGYSSTPEAQQEQCTVTLHYYPRIEIMRGCTAALDDDVLLGENMCSSEAEDLLRIVAAEDQQFPMRRMYQEHSFPAAAWMGAWKATALIANMALVWSCLWGFQSLLSRCKALGPIHRRFVSLHAGQQRNVSLYLTHLSLDSLALVYVFRPMIELWFGLTETVAEVRVGVQAFTYLVACYALELTWRRSIDTMLAIHHLGTISIILMFAGELTSSTYRSANNIIVLAAFALIEQPTYVALLLKRMMPSHSIHVVRAARVGYISWFWLKGASVLIAASMFVEDWHIMPVWLRINFLVTWGVAMLVQGWSGFIQKGIYKHIKRAYKRSRLDYKQDQLKRQAAVALHAQACTGSSSEDEPDGGSALASRANSGAELSAPLLRSRRVFGSDSLDCGHGSPFKLITAGMPELGDAFESGSCGTSRTSSDPERNVHTHWSHAVVQDSADLGRLYGRLSTSTSFVNISQAGISAPLLQPRGSLPLAVERSLNSQQGSGLQRGYIGSQPS